MLPPGPADAVSWGAAGAASVVCTGAGAAVVWTGTAGPSSPPGAGAAVVLVVPEPPGETGDGEALPPGDPADASVVLCAGLGDELFPEWPGPS